MNEVIIEDILSFTPALKRIDSVLIGHDPILLDLFFLENFNALILKDFEMFETNLSVHNFQDYVEINHKKDLDKLNEYTFRREMKAIIFDLLSELDTSILGIQKIGPKFSMCPKYHVDQLPLRIVQCIDGPGTTLLTPNGTVVETEKNDLIFLKGELWKSECGAIKHKSPETLSQRSICRIDFLN